MSFEYAEGFREGEADAEEEIRTGRLTWSGYGESFGFVGEFDLPTREHGCIPDDETRGAIEGHNRVITDHMSRWGNDTRLSSFQMPVAERFRHLRRERGSFFLGLDEDGVVSPDGKFRLVVEPARPAKGEKPFGRFAVDDGRSLTYLPGGWIEAGNRIEVVFDDDGSDLVLTDFLIIDMRSGRILFADV